VLRGETLGYRQHPQLQRFRQQATPLLAINAYLSAVHAEPAMRVVPAMRLLGAPDPPA
jgi:hypothetical protein